MDQTNPATAPSPDHTWMNLLADLTRTAVALERHRTPHRCASLYRRNIMANLRAALDQAVDREVLLERPPAVGGTSVAGLYRDCLTAGLPDWADAMTGAEVVAAVQDLLDAELAEVEWPAEVVPEPPDGEFRYELLDRTSSYEVTVGGSRLAYVYLQFYYPTVRHVVAHLMRKLGDEELVGDEVVDFAVWSDGTLRAAAHMRWDRDEDVPMIQRFQVAYFDGDGSDLNLEDRVRDDEDLLPFEATLPGWPTREQWEADGSDQIILRPKGDPAWDRTANV